MPPVYNNKPRILPAPNKSQIIHYTGAPAPAEDEELLPLHHYLWLLRRNWSKIALAVSTATALTALFCFLVTPIYEATARITADTKVPTTVLGQDTGGENTSDVEEFLTTEMDLIQSDAVLRPVAERFHLLPVPEHGAPSSAIEGAVTLPGLTVTHPANSLLLRITYRSKDPQQAADVANAVAQSYIDQAYGARVRSSMKVSGFMEKQLDDLKGNMDASNERLAAYERQLGVVDPEQQTSVLAARVLQLNTDYTEAENDRIRKEAAYRSVESGNPSAIDISTQAEQLTKLQQQLQDAQQKMALLKTTYGPNYAEYKKGENELAEVTREYDAARADIGKRIQTDYTQSANHEAMLAAALASAKGEADKLNASSIQYQQLKRDAEANKTLYNELFQKIKEAGINSGFQNSTVRIAAEARPQLAPVFPKKGIFTFLGFFISLVGSIAVVLLRDMMDKSVRDPDQARRMLNVEVLGVLPDVHQIKPAGRQLLLDDGAGIQASGKRPIDWSRSEDAYTEAIRTMRSLVLLERSRENLRSLLVTSALAGEGKSTCTAHLAIAHALQGRKTLLIDADLRRPSQHNHFALPNTDGLAEVILDGRGIADVCKQIPGLDNLHVVTAGHLFSKASHLVGTRMPKLLEEAGEDYDLVVIDAPPMLGLAEPIQIACAADGVILIARAGETDSEAVGAALGTLNRLDVNVLGLVLNKVRKEMSSSYGHYGVYTEYAPEPALGVS